MVTKTLAHLQTKKLAVVESIKDTIVNRPRGSAERACGVGGGGRMDQGAAGLAGLAWLGLAWPGLAWLGPTWPGLPCPALAWLGLAWPRLA